MSLPGRIPADAYDDDEEWMAFFRSLPDPDVDALLAGQHHSLADVHQLDDLIVTLRAATARHGAPPMSAALFAQIQREQPVVDPGRRWRLVVAAASCLLFGGTAVGIAGAQDVLPSPLQDATASVATVFGLDLPRSTDRDPEPRTSADPDDGADSGDGATQPDGGTTDPTDPTDPTLSGDPSDAGEPGSSGPTQGPPETTPGGATPATPATPADPGTPGDHEPATPATPATPSAGNGQGKGNNQGNGQANAQANGRGRSEGAPRGVQPPSTASAMAPANR